jgi:nucleoside-diphosphate-sugar epimerase
MISIMVLITGVAGFIGSNLADYFISRGIEVIGVDNFDSFYERRIKENNILDLFQSKNFHFFEGDIRDMNFLNRLPGAPSLVIHLAAKAGVQPSLKQPQEYVDVNIQGSISILEWMKNRQIKKLIFASSSSVYGANNCIPFVESDTGVNPVSPYAFTKRSMELANHTYHHLYQFDIINLRFFTVYGKRQRPDLAIHKFFKAIYEGEPIQLYGSGDTQRDYTYIDDIVEGIFHSYEYLTSNVKVFETLNLGNSSPIRLLELLEKIERVCGKKAIKEFVSEKPGDMTVTYACIEKAKKMIGYSPKTSLDEGLVKFNEWYSKKIKYEETKHRYSYL